MLNKSICKKCIDIYSEQKWDYGTDDTNRWDVEGRVICPTCVKVECSCKINELPPSDCMFALEHVIFNQRMQQE